MLLRELHAQVSRMRRMAAEAPLHPDHAALLIQPFIDKFKTLRLSMNPAPAPQPVARHPRHAEILSATLAAGVCVQRQHLKGLPFHNGYLRALAQAAPQFNYCGFTECSAIYLGESAVNPEVWGRVDVAWAAGRDPQVIFEIDSTVKPASLWKLKQAQVPHKFWVYFGKDIWRFKTFLKTHDPAREVTPIILPKAWKP